MKRRLHFTKTNTNVKSVSLYTNNIYVDLRGHPVRSVPGFCQRYKVSPSYDRIFIIRFHVMAGGQIRDYTLLTFKRKLKFI